MAYIYVTNFYILFIAGIISTSSAAYPVKTCPKPSQDFIGRRDALAMIHEYYFGSATSGQRVFVLHGSAASGKTQIARMFVEQYGQQQVLSSLRTMIP